MVWSPCRNIPFQAHLHECRRPSDLSMTFSTSIDSCLIDKTGWNCDPSGLLGGALISRHIAGHEARLPAPHSTVDSQMAKLFHIKTKDSHEEVAKVIRIIRSGA